jgi:hypothetical protein
VVDWDLYLKQITSPVEQIAAQVTVEVARLKKLMNGSLRPGTSALIIVLALLAPLSNGTAADGNPDVQTLLSQATSQIQSMVISMSQGCAGGAHGVLPVNWANLQAYGDSAVRRSPPQDWHSQKVRARMLCNKSILLRANWMPYSMVCTAIVLEARMG